MRRFCGLGATRLLLAASKADRVKDRVAAQLDLEEKMMGKIATYPHRVLTRPVLPVEPQTVTTANFSSRLDDLCRIATDLRCISFSAPKAYWDASVIILKSNPDEQTFEVWVNPEVPGYDDRHAIAPMYGMWENCISCGACQAWVVRPQRITCAGTDQFGNRKVEVLDGLRARLLMHELDHLRGKTIIQQALGPEFVVSGVAMNQRNQWPPNFPSAEAFITAPQMFFDYVQNTTIVPPGLEWWYAQSTSTQEFSDQQLGH